MNGNQAFLVGLILGRLMGIANMGQFDVEPIMDGGAYTNEIKITRASGVYRLVVEKE